jgi:cytoskeletal protein RodZ
MRKETSLFATLALAATLTPFTFAQQPDQAPSNSPSATQPQEQTPSSSPTSDPSMQQQPSSPSPDSASPSTASPSTSTGPDSSQTVSSYTGQVVKAGGKYVLKANGMNYQLDDQDKAKQFNGQTVKVNGDLDKSTSTIHVTDISPAS